MNSRDRKIIFESIFFSTGNGADRTTSCQNKQEEWGEEENDDASQGKKNTLNLC